MLERQLPEGPDRRRADVTSRRAALELAGVVAIVLGASGCCLLRRRAPDPLTHALETDTGTSVGAGPRDTPEAERIREKRDRDRARYGPDGYQLPQEKIDEVSGSNCHGVTFDRGGSQVHSDATGGGVVIRDNYMPVEAGGAQVCDVVVWGDPPAHSGLVVEVDGGRPTRVVSKDGSRGEPWVHDPAKYDPPNAPTVHRRRGPPPDPTATDAARQAYDAAKRAHETETDTSRKEERRRAMHLAAYELCRRRNALRRGSLPADPPGVAATLLLTIERDRGWHGAAGRPPGSP